MLLARTPNPDISPKKPAAAPELQDMEAGQLRVSSAPDGLPDQAVYLDSPVLSAVTQIRPFFESGAFGVTDTPLFLRQKPLLRLQRALGRLPQELDVRWIKRRAARLPVAAGGVVFYPFNARSNLQTVTRRDIRHVLTLHGESNKGASMRPAARIYDYVSIAGPLARDRYLKAGIFTADDVDRGRLVMMGDTFVQPMPEIRAARSCDADPALFYAPTWEGFGGQADNYSSLSGLRGIAAVLAAADATGLRRVVIKPHPYLGLLRPAIIRSFVAGVRQLRQAGLRVSVMMEDASVPLRLACLRALRRAQHFLPDRAAPLPVALGLCDVSGMEAIFLKQRIAHLVLSREDAVPRDMASLYLRKALLPESDVARVMTRYLAEGQEIDAAHRAQVFGWTEPSLADRPTFAARGWLLEYVKRDPFWRVAGG
ncbi:hypothetical protein J7400_19940 [Shimia sp. R9_2]|uniref:hypothetical protein n=1 Tax=Shimia sp. R9_2 TaxID=2821112 RepID=UPI001ADA7BB2|nr:hypothetical protein [Shimia sp. R9_2]MBO9398953.1 hypothetical protein [Shimia sp. R9_2]